MIFIINAGGSLKTGNWGVPWVDWNAHVYTVETDNLLVQKVPIQSLVKENVRNSEIQEGTGLRVSMPVCFQDYLDYWEYDELVCFDKQLVYKRDKKLFFKGVDLSLKFSWTGSACFLYAFGKCLCTYHMADSDRYVRNGLAYAFRVGDYLILRWVVVISGERGICTTLIVNNKVRLVGVVADNMFKSTVYITSRDPIFSSKLAALGGRY